MPATAGQSLRELHALSAELCAAAAEITARSAALLRQVRERTGRV